MASVKGNPFSNKRTTVRNSPLTPGNQLTRENQEWSSRSAAANKAYNAARTMAPNKPGEGSLRLWARGPGYANITQRTPVGGKKKSK